MSFNDNFFEYKFTIILHHHVIEHIFQKCYFLPLPHGDSIELSFTSKIQISQPWRQQTNDLLYNNCWLFPIEWVVVFSSVIRYVRRGQLTIPSRRCWASNYTQLSDKEYKIHGTLLLFQSKTVKLDSRPWWVFFDREY